MEITSEQSASQQLRLSLRKYRVWAVVAATVVTHLLIAARSVGPMYVFDEVGYLAGANIYSGQGVDWSLCGSSYAVGYSVVLAPLWWLPVSPIVVYQIAALISAALGALAIWPATLLARRFGAHGAVALGIGALVTLIPARALMDNYVLAENPLTLLVLCTALLAVKVADRGRRIDVILLATVAGLASIVHARAVPLVAVTVAWIVVRAILKQTRWLDATLAALVAGVLAIGGVVAQTAMGARVFAEDSRVGDLVGHLNIVRIGEVVLGQAFTQVVSWLLLTVLGLLVCVSKARTAVRGDGRSGIGAVWWWLGGMVIAQAVFFVWVLAGSADYGTRLDTPIFGRYLDPFAVPIAVLGATSLWLGASKRIKNIALIVAVSAVVAFGALVLPRTPVDGVWIPFAIPGLAPFMSLTTGDDRPALAIAGLVAIAGCALLWLSRHRLRIGLSVALVVAVSVTLATDLLRLDPQEESVRASSSIVEFLDNNATVPATLAADLLTCADRNKLQLELVGRAPVVPSGGDYGDGAIVGPTEWPAAKASGLSRVPFTQWEDAAVWAKLKQDS